MWEEAFQAQAFSLILCIYTKVVLRGVIHFVPLFLGRNNFGQLGHGDKERRDVPTLIESLDGINIIDAACGRNHSLVLSGKVNTVIIQIYNEDNYFQHWAHLCRVRKNMC